MAEVDRLASIIALLQSQPALQTPAVCATVRQLTRLAGLLGSSMLVMAAEDQQRGREGRGEGIGEGGVEWLHLEVMLDQVRDVRKELEEGVVAVCPGLRGGVREGWGVEKAFVVEVDESVKGVLGVGLLVVERLGLRLEGGAGELFLSLFSLFLFFFSLFYFSEEKVESELINH